MRLLSMFDLSWVLALMNDDDQYQYSLFSDNTYLSSVDTMHQDTQGAALTFLSLFVGITLSNYNHKTIK